MRKDVRSHMLSAAGVVLLTVAALTACTSADADDGVPPKEPTSSPPASTSPQEDTSGGLRSDPEAFQRFMMTCMDEKGWAVVAARDGAVSPADESYSAEPAFNDALTECVEDAAIPYLE